MTVWYHLSSNPDLSPAINELRQPVIAHDESELPRLCVAPTVCQCLLALSNEGAFNIYQMELDGLETPDNSVWDAEQTGEKWITQVVLDKHSGSIPLRRVAEIAISKEHLLFLKCAMRSNPKIDWSVVEDRLWNKSEEKWTPTFGTMDDVRRIVGDSRVE